jgi:hypothetical protein
MLTCVSYNIIQLIFFHEIIALQRKILESSRFDLIREKLFSVTELVQITYNCLATFKLTNGYICTRQLCKIYLNFDSCSALKEKIKGLSWTSICFHQQKMTFSISYTTDLKVFKVSKVEFLQ